MKIISRQEFSNGMTMIVQDRSRLAAGDRWHVILDCHLRMTVPDDLTEGSFVSGEQEAGEVRRVIGDELQHTITRKRHFVEVGKVDEIRDELCRNLLDHGSRYLSAPTFPAQLLRRRCAEVLASPAARIEDCREEDGDEPADFSACFSDP